MPACAAGWRRWQMHGIHKPSLHRAVLCSGTVENCRGQFSNVPELSRTVLECPTAERSQQVLVDPRHFTDCRGAAVSEPSAGRKSTAAGFRSPALVLALHHTPHDRRQPVRLAWRAPSAGARWRLHAGALGVFDFSCCKWLLSPPSRRRRERQTRFCRPLRASCCALTGSALKSRCCRLHLPANLLWRARCRVAPHHHGELVQQRAHASGHCVRRVQLNLIMSIAEFGQWSCVQPAVSQGQSALRT